MKMARDQKAAADAAARAQSAAAEKAGASWKAAYQAVMGAAVVAYAVRAVKAIASITQEAIAARRELSGMAKVTGLSADTVQALKLAADGTGQKLADFQRPLMILPKLLGQVEAGNKAAAAKFQRLGVDVLDAEGKMRSADAVFRDVVEAVGKIEDPTRRAAAATDLFGRNAATMIKVFAGGAEQFEALDKFAQHWGVSTALDATKEANNLRQEMAALGLVIRGIKDPFAELISKKWTGALKFLTLDLVMFAGAVKGAFGQAQEEVRTFVTSASALLNAGSLKEGLAAASKLLSAQFAAPRLLSAGLRRAADDARQFVTDWTALEGAIKSGADAITESDEEIERSGKRSVKAQADALQRLGDIANKSAAEMISAEDRISNALVEQIAEIDRLAEGAEVGSKIWIAAETARSVATVSAEKQIADVRAAAAEREEEERRKIEEARLRAAEEAAAEEIRIARAVSDAKIGLASETFSALGSLAETFAGESERGQRRAFYVNKIAGIAQAILSGLIGIARAQESDTYSRPFLTAASVIQAAAAVAAVAAASPPSFYVGGTIEAPQAYTGMDFTYAASTGTTIPMTVHPGEQGQIKTRSEVEQSQRPTTTHVETWIGAPCVADTVASEVRRGGAVTAELARRAGRLGHSPVWR